MTVPKNPADSEHRFFRRRFLRFSGALLAAPRASFAQQSASLRRIGVLSSFSRASSAAWHTALEEGLRELGWVDGKNINIAYRFAEGSSDRLAAHAVELAGLKPELIVADESTDAQAARAATRSIPIVMASAGAATEIGLIDTLARPGGNVTGLSQMTPELAGKHLQLLREIIPGIARVAVLWNPLGKTSALGWQEMQRSAKAIGIQLRSVEVRKTEDFERAFREISAARAGALASLPHPVIATNLTRISAFALKSRLPSTFHLKEFAELGGLIAYGPNRTEMFRRSAIYVDKILKGARPETLPVEQPTKFDLVINLKTAKAIGLAISESVLFRADRVIE